MKLTLATLIAATAIATSASAMTNVLDGSVHTARDIQDAGGVHFVDTGSNASEVRVQEWGIDVNSGATGTYAPLGSFSGDGDDISFEG